MHRTAALTAGAVSHTSTDWHALPWQSVNEHVRRLQARIVQATKAGKWHKVQALQHLLTHSFSGKALAVRRVTANQGKNTPGVDKVIWQDPASKWMARHHLHKRGYKALPLRRVYIPKANGKKRSLGIPTMKDSAMQALSLQALAPIAAPQAAPNSYGLRKERSCADAMAQCATALSHSTSAQWILAGEMPSCCDTISHDWLLSHIPMEKAILSTWLKAGYMDRSVLYATEDGTPQGGISSPVLATMTLDGLETILRKTYPQVGSQAVKGKNKQVNLVRYADDLIITGHSQEVLEPEVIPLVVTFLQERGLERSEKKTRITPIKDGLDFLGQHGRKYPGQFLTRPATTNVKTFLANIRKGIRGNKQATAYGLIALLHPTRREGASFHRHAAAKETFVHVATAICKALWRWARRRHPKKAKRWVADRYFKQTGKRNWHFFGTGQDKDGKRITNELCHASALPVTRHTNMKGACNPYDPSWAIYLEARLGVKMEHTLRGRRPLAHLWKEPGGTWPVCAQPLTHVTGWHNHHIVYKTMGGTDGMSNRVLIHPHCHRQVHAKGLTVSKPRPVKAVAPTQPGALCQA